MGFPLCCLLTATGAFFCYLLVSNFARHLVVQCCHKKILALQKKVNEHLNALIISYFFSLSMEKGRKRSRQSLLCSTIYANGTHESQYIHYSRMSTIKCAEENLLFLHSFWFVQDQRIFILTTLLRLSLGMAPYTFITVQMGSFLSQLNSLNDLFTGRTLLTLALIAAVVGCTGLIVARVRRQIPQTVIQ